MTESQPVSRDDSPDDRYLSVLTTSVSPHHLPASPFPVSSLDEAAPTATRRRSSPRVHESTSERGEEDATCLDTQQTAIRYLKERTVWPYDGENKVNSNKGEPTE